MKYIKHTIRTSHKVDVKNPRLKEFVTRIKIGALLNAKTHLGLD